VRGSIVARSYANALFELGERHGAHDDLVHGLNTMTSLLGSDPRIRSFMETPKIDIASKQQALRSALGSQVSTLFMNFMLVVLRKRRQRLLTEIAAAYRDLLDEKLDRVHVQVTVAHEPDEGLEEQIRVELARILGRSVLPHVHVDPAILGGIIVRYGDNVIDGSLRRRLIGLRQRLITASVAVR
jgi:F-type H+-transporting ATPase subunit delta